MLDPSLVTPRTDLNLPPTAIVAPTPQLKRMFLTVLNDLHPDLYRKFQKKPLLISGVCELLVGDSFSLLGPVTGAPLAVLGLEPLLCSGVRNVVLIGAGGGLTAPNDKLRVGDIVFPTGVLSEESTSKHYCDSTEQLTVENSLQLALEETLRGKLADPECSLKPELKRGLIWTTDVAFRETRNKVEEYRQLGARLVEMEFSALLALSHAYGARLAAAFVVSDLLGEGWSPGFGSAEFKTSVKLLCSSVLLNHQASAEVL